MRHRLHYRAVVLAAVCTLALTLTMGQYLIPFNPRAAVGGCTWTEVSDNFNRSSSDSLGANWTETVGDTDIVNDTQLQQGGGGSMEVAWDNGDTPYAARQYACAQRVMASATDFQGPKLRIPNLSGTSASYAVRWDGGDDVHFRTCTGASCSTFGDWNELLNLTNWLCAEVQGTSSSTEFAAWEETTQPGDRDTWGDPDACVCDGGTCSFYTGCGTIIDAEPSDTGSYQDCGSGCYLGLYSGSSVNGVIDNFTGGWCE